MKKNRTFLFIILIVLGVFPMILSASISVTPSLLELKIPPGKSFTDAILVTNVGKGKVNVSVYLSDFLLNQEGNIEFYDAGTDKYSLAAYMRVNPTSFTLEPKEEKWVRFTVTAPVDQKGESQSIIFFHTQSIRIKNPQGKNVLVSARVGTTVYAALKTTIEQAAEVKDVFIKQNPNDSSFDYSIIFHNTGNIHVRPQGSLKILDQKGKTLIDTVLNEKNSSVLRNSYRIFEGTFTSKSKFSDGLYTAQVQFDYGEKIIEVEKPVFILGQGDIDFFNAAYTPADIEGKLSSVDFKAGISGLKDFPENKDREIRFRLKSADSRLLADIPVESIQVNGQTSDLEFNGQWEGDLQPGIYFAEFLFFVEPSRPATSFYKLTVKD